MARDLAAEWNKRIHTGVDQSYLKRDKEADGGTDVYTRSGLGNRCFCMSCGVDGGCYLKFTTDIIFICDDCAFRYGGIPLPEIPPEELNELVSYYSPDHITNLTPK